jgi:hypothetical protein
VSATRLRTVGRLAASPRDAWLLARMFAWGLVLPVLKFALPLPRLVRLVASPRRRARDAAREAAVAEQAARVYRWRRDDNCLERSLVTFRYLGRAGADPRLVVGMRASDRFGHVWVTTDGAAVHDAPEFLAELEPLFEFDADGTRVSA